MGSREANADMKLGFDALVRRGPVAHVATAAVGPRVGVLGESQCFTRLQRL